RSRPGRIAAEGEVPGRGQVAEVAVVQLHHEGLRKRAALLELLADFRVGLAWRGAYTDVSDPHHLQRYLRGAGGRGEDLNPARIAERGDKLHRRRPARRDGSISPR